jgi:hypothetical protein
MTDDPAQAAGQQAASSESTGPDPAMVVDIALPHPRDWTPPAIGQLFRRPGNCLCMCDTSTGGGSGNG